MNIFDKQILNLPKARGMLVFLIVTALLDALLVIGMTLPFAHALSELWHEAQTGQLDIMRQAPFIAAFACGYMLRQLLSVVRSRFMDKRAQELSFGLVERLTEALYESGPVFVQAFGSGAVTATFSEGADRIKSYIELSLRKSVDMMVVPVLLAVTLLVLDWVSGIIALVIIPCVIFFMRLLGQNTRDAARAQHAEYERLTNHFADVMGGFPTIKMFGRSSTYETQVYDQSENLRHATMRTLRTAMLSSLVLDMFRTFALAAISILLGFRLMAGAVGLFIALAVLVLVPEYFAPIRRYSADFHSTLEGKNQLKALLSMLDYAASLAVQRNHNCTKLQLDSSHDLQSGQFSVDKLSFTHMPDSQGVSAQTVRDVSFSVTAPCKVGIVGASGAGKTTLINILAGFARPDETSCFEVAGKQCNSLCDPSWQEHLTYIPQHPHLFSASLRDNIAFYYPEARDEEIGEALRAVGLGDLLATFDEGLDTQIGQGGRALSGGQAQRVALARALLDKKRSVWLFDEPTAHLDIETELELKESMLPLMEGRLVFFATHRLHWMRDMDVLLVLRDGQLAETGSYDELIAANGVFASLVQQLQGGYR